ncbi:hypothetical protein swp_3231 [Shewanella piezotolerans WP3]|uniref:DNA methylase adenine-specific domain-containing protein n=1 Tax=Shewanella piezotolerans (strain WP3 / JCM 13877) TaxID=225849 RepID=B8CRC9_SHEPW|nr:hypothetical protein [Shewanella piezotolerans]ACJ29937.1 hypothetical protein swp_3231 [Shewanella piezotolerans WP3]
MSHLQQAVKLVQEGDRYSGHGRFFSEFIDDWAYRQTGLYDPSKPLSEAQSKIAHQLSHVIRSAWETCPGEDFIGHLIEECGGSGHLSFFRTPPALSTLMANMMGGSSGLEDFADICCGSGSLTLAHINQTFLDGGAKAVARLNIMCEDLSGNKIKVAMLQIVNLLDILSDGKPLYVHSLQLSEVNSLSREFGSVQYDFTGANNPRSRLSEEQKVLVHQALLADIDIGVISERLRVPVNLVRRECQVKNGNVYTKSGPKNKRYLLGNVQV